MTPQEGKSPAPTRVSTPHLNLYSAVWEAAGYMTDVEVIEYVKGTLRDMRSDDNEPDARDGAATVSAPEQTPAA